MEKIWKNLWRRKRKKVKKENEEDEIEDIGSDKENLKNEEKNDTIVIGERSCPQRVLVTSSVGNETFPRANLPTHSTHGPQGPRWTAHHNNVAASASSLGPSRSVPYEQRTWTRSQHFHYPYGQERQSSSRTGLSMGYSSRSLIQGEKRRETTLKRPVEPGDRYKSTSSVHHFHIPGPAPRLVYNRPGTRTAMSRLVEQFSNTSPRTRSPSMNNEEPITLAHYPGGTPSQTRLEREYITAPPFGDQERKRRRSGSVMEEEEEIEHEELKHEKNVDLVEEEKMKRNEEELKKISSGIGKVFLDTIRKTEKIRSARGTNIDPRSAARTPSANRMPKYRLRYDSPAWASPSRDTLHARPWDSVEDLACPVVLTSSGCASGCNSDHYPSAALASLGPYRSTSTLIRSHPSLVTGTLHRPVTPPKPGYTQSRASTLPHIRSVSGRIIDQELELVTEDVDHDGDEGSVSNPHSGVITTVSNSFSWATLAKFQTDEADRKIRKNTYFKRPMLKHSGTLLDLQ